VCAQQLANGVDVCELNLLVPYAQDEIMIMMKGHTCIH
jgi:hypothetical protein